MNVVYHILDFERQTKAEEERGGQTHEDEQTPGLKETDPDPETEDRTTRSTSPDQRELPVQLDPPPSIQPHDARSAEVLLRCRGRRGCLQMMDHPRDVLVLTQNWC